MYHILNVLISNLSFVFENFEPKIPNLGILSQKVSVFPILAKFHMSPILKVLILNLTLVFETFKPECPNLGILGQKLFILNEIFPGSYFEGANFKSDFRFRKCWNFITSLIKINYFVFWFYLHN